MAVVATQIKKGQCIEYSGEKLMVLDLDPVSYTHLTLPTNREV